MIKKIFKYSLLILFFGLSFPKANHLFKQLKTNIQFVNQEPAAESYFSDELRYLKTYYLMKEGLNYYQAHLKAFENVAGGWENVWTKDVWGWRLPFIFYLWKFSTNKYWGVFTCFVVGTLISLFNTYLIAKKYVDYKIAFLAPLMIIPYYLNAFLSTSFLFITWWGLFFFITGLTFFFYDKFSSACLFFIFTVLSRELFIVAIGAMLIVSFLYKRNRLVFLTPIIIFLIMIFYHNHQVSQVIRLDRSFAINERLTEITKIPLLTTLSFSTNSYWLVQIRPALIWLSASICGLSYLIVKNKKQRYLALISLMSFFPFFISLSIIGQTVWEDYWGPVYVPLAEVFSLTVLRILNNEARSRL